MSPHAATLAWFQVNQYVLFSLMLHMLELTIYHTRGEHANHYTTDAVRK
jgi:hypothetical protein